MRISDWSSDVCSSDLTCGVARGADRIGRGPPRMTPLPPGSTIGILGAGQLGRMIAVAAAQLGYRCHIFAPSPGPGCAVARTFTAAARSEEHTSELQSLMRTSYDDFSPTTQNKQTHTA